MSIKVDLDLCDHVFAWKNLYVNDRRVSKCIFCGKTQQHKEEF